MNVSNKEATIPADVLHRLIQSVFVALGMNEVDASVMAGAMTFADLRGISSHGVALLPYYVGLIERGVDPRGRPKVIRDHGAALVVDASNAMGHISATFAMHQCIERARTTGVAVAVVGNSNHCGAMSAYATLALPEKMIGLATTNAMPSMAPWGGLDRIVGINPLAMALPSQTEPPFVLDTAFSTVARGKIVLHDQQGRTLPEGWAFDAEGRPTTDPTAALAGLLVPIGGPKGVGLAMAMGVLSTLLSGAAYGTELGSLVDGPRSGRDGHLLLALNVSAFVDPVTFTKRMDGVLEQLRTSRSAEGQVIRAPGERAYHSEQERRSRGVPLALATRDRVLAVAERLGVGTRALETK